MMQKNFRYSYKAVTDTSEKLLEQPKATTLAIEDTKKNLAGKTSTFAYIKKRFITSWKTI